MSSTLAYYSSVVYLFCDVNMPPDDDGLLVAFMDHGGIALEPGTYVTLTDGEGGLRNAVVVDHPRSLVYRVRPDGYWWQGPTVEFTRVPV